MHLMVHRFLLAYLSDLKLFLRNRPGYEKLTLSQVKALAREGASKSAEQALTISSANKYEKPGEHYLAAMFDLLRKYSANPIEDSMKLWDMVIFNFLIGNTDNHVKNDINREAFEASAQECGIGKRIALKHFDTLANNFEKGLRTAAEKMTEQIPGNLNVLRERILKSCGYASIA